QVEGCPVPILVLGGEKTDSVRSVFQDIHDSLSAGGKGIAVGRNIWEHGDVDTMLTVAMNLVHENWSVDQACDFIGIA
ncbi:MAG: aldolase, partial [Sphaerochaetaceae bacterium]